MNINKIKTYINFAIRSRHIIFGYDNIIVYKKKQSLILISSTSSDKISEKLISFANENNIKYIIPNIAVEELVGRDNCKMLSIVDDSLATAIIKELEC